MIIILSNLSLLWRLSTSQDSYIVNLIPAVNALKGDIMQNLTTLYYSRNESNFYWVYKMRSWDISHFMKREVEELNVLRHYSQDIMSLDLSSIQFLYHVESHEILGLNNEYDIQIVVKSQMHQQSCILQVKYLHDKMYRLLVHEWFLHSNTKENEIISNKF